jgi:hypothetical protein
VSFIFERATGTIIDLAPFLLLFLFLLIVEIIERFPECFESLLDLESKSELSGLSQQFSIIIALLPTLLCSFFGGL